MFIYKSIIDDMVIEKVNITLRVKHKLIIMTLNVYSYTTRCDINETRILRFPPRNEE